MGFSIKEIFTTMLAAVYSEFLVRIDEHFKITDDWRGKRKAWPGDKK